MSSPMSMSMSMYVPTMSLLLTWQYADGFNQRLSFDVSSVTSMSLMFEVRPAREPCPQYS